MKIPLILLLLVLFGCTTQQPPVNITPGPGPNGTVQDGITSFEECVAAGNPIMESYPRQCRAGNTTFVSLADVFEISKNSSCSEDADCMLVDGDYGFRCCWAGACDALDYSLDNWIAVNKAWFDAERQRLCPETEQCGPAPGCAVRTVNLNYTAICMNSTCLKAELISANLTEVQEPPENMSNATTMQPPVPDGVQFDGYVLALDDVVLPRFDATCGAFSVWQDGTLLDKLLICEKQSKYWTGPDGHRFRIFVVEIAGGYTYKEKWADVRIYG